MHSSRSSPSKPTSIRRLHIDELFGYLTYTVPRARLPHSDFDRLIILYGDNGAGKTTILRLIFSILSPHRNRGDKTFVYRTPFRNIQIDFDNGLTIRAYRIGVELVGDYFIGIRQRLTGEQVFPVTAEPGTMEVKNSEETRALIVALANIGIALYFLPDDRRVRSTFPLELSADLEETTAEATRRLFGLYATRSDLYASRQREESHHLDIEPVLGEVNSWLRGHALLGSNTGEENTTSIYLRVVEQVAHLTGHSELLSTESQNQLLQRLNTLTMRIGEFTRFGLIAPFPGGRFLEIVNHADDEAKQTIATVLEPYVDGIEARLAALEEVKDVITTYVETTNSFLSNKSIDFTLREGVAIKGIGRTNLDPNWLSSGEKQLMLLLSNTVLARDSAGIFLIDEPELSLNVKWQRRLVEALLRCAHGANIQYLLASHSLELITQHRPNAVQLIAEPSEREAGNA